MSASDSLLARLKALGVDTVFGIPGVDNLPFYEALDRSDIRSVLVRHEQTAGYAADAYMRITGRSAVCFTTAGPGAANAITSMGEAWASGSGFLHLTTTVATSYGTTPRPRSLPHYHPRQIDLFRPVSKLALHCDDPNDLADMAEEAIRAVQTPPHSPTYVEVPFDLLAAPVTRESDPASSYQEPGPPDAADLARAVELLGNAKRIVIWAGSGSLQAIDEILELAERYDAPVVVTYGAKRRWARFDHPLIVESTPHESAIAELIETADAALVLGSDLDAMMTAQFSLRFPRRLVHVDVEPSHIGMNFPAEVAIVGRVAQAVPELLKAAPARAVPGHSVGRVAAARARIRAGFSAQGRGNIPRRFLDALDIAMPTDGIVVADMAVPGYWTARYASLAPHRRLLHPLGWGTLGSGLPLAIGACVAAPRSRTFLVIGDAGLLYAVGDLATVAELALPLTVIVVDDGGYGMLRYAAEVTFGRTFAVDLGSPDLEALARSFGLQTWASRLEDPGMPGVIAEAGRADGPSVVVLTGSMPPPPNSILGIPPRPQAG